MSRLVQRQPPPEMARKESGSAVSYIRNTGRAHTDALRIRQQIAAAEVEKQERELLELRELEQELARLQRRKALIAKELAETRARTTTTRRQLALPLPVYGGKVGLLAAAQEVKQHAKRKKELVG